MSTRVATRLSLTLLLLTIIAAAAGYVLVAYTWSTAGADELAAAPTTAINLLGALASSCVGAVIASRRPQHVIGWLFLAAGVYGALQATMDRYVIYGLITDPGAVPGPGLAASFLGASFIFTITLIVLLLIYFPSGQAPSRRWQQAAYLAVVSTFVAYLGFVLQPSRLDPPFAHLENALGIEALNGIEALAIAALLVLFALTVTSTIGAIVRFRRSEGEEREQFKWFVSVASLIPIFVVVHSTADIAAPEAVNLIEVLFGVVLILIPVAVGIAVLKYRLYEIDVIINRTLVYVPLTAILAGLYVTMTGLSRTVFTELSGAGSDAAIAISTLAVVALLTPLKNQLQAIVDRHFKEQHDPARDLKRLTGETRSVLQVMDTDKLLRRFLETTTQALDAEGGAIELRNGATPRLITSDAWDGASSLTLPLQYDGEELGSLMIGRNRRGRLYGEADAEALKESVEVLSHALKLAEERSVGSSD